MIAVTRRALASACALMLPSIPMVGLAPPAAAQVAPAEGMRQVGGLVVYLGVMPAAVVQGHPPGHPESTMHGGTPTGRHIYHLVVAVFEAASGARVTDAEVAATVSGLGHLGQTRMPLEPMTVAEALSYGGFVALPGSDLYRITVEIRRPGATGTSHAEFTYRHAPS